MRIRLTMNPGRSAETITCLPSSAASSRTAASVASSVAAPRISSTSGITGTGLKKCMPTNRARLASATAAARRSMAMDDVLEAKMAPAGAIPSSAAHSARLDLDVLEHRLDDEVGVRGHRRGPTVPVRRARIASRSSAASLPFATARSRLPAIRASPASARARSGS